MQNRKVEQMNLTVAVQISPASETKCAQYEKWPYEKCDHFSSTISRRGLCGMFPTKDGMRRVIYNYTRCPQCIAAQIKENKQC